MIDWLTELLNIVALLGGLILGGLGTYLGIKSITNPEERRTYIKGVSVFWGGFFLFVGIPVGLDYIGVTTSQRLVPISMGVFVIVMIPVIFWGSKRNIESKQKLYAFEQAAVAELQEARQMQMSLLPQNAPEISGFDIAGSCEPATDVGGDYFTYLWLDEARTQLAIVLMDVTGHGMKAAMTTLLANGMLQSEIRYNSSPREILTRMHHSLKQNLVKRTFVATALAHITVTSKTLTYFNAGLPHPVLLRNGKRVFFEIQNSVPLGCGLSGKYIGTSVPLCSGDVLLLFSDGLAEARDVNGREYETIRLEKRISSLLAQSLSAQELLETILSDVQEFATPNGFSDDMTVVVVKVK